MATLTNFGPSARISSMLEDSCPNCGHRRKPMVMATRSDATLSEMWRGDGEPFQFYLLRIAAIIIPMLVLAQVFHWVHI